MPPVTSEQLELLLESNRQAAGSLAAIAADIEGVKACVTGFYRLIVVGLFMLLAGVLASTGYYKAVTIPGLVGDSGATP
jgi:hypothetical protein